MYNAVEIQSSIITNARDNLMQNVSLLVGQVRPDVRDRVSDAWSNLCMIKGRFSEDDLPGLWDTLTRVRKSIQGIMREPGAIVLCEKLRNDPKAPANAVEEMSELFVELADSLDSYCDTWEGQVMNVFARLADDSMNNNPDELVEFARMCDEVARTANAMNT